MSRSRRARGLNRSTSRQPAHHVRAVLEALEDRAVPSAVTDFNGDGYADLAAGVPYGDHNEALDAGAVHIVYGTDRGLSAANSQVFVQDTFGFLDPSEAYDRFGFSLATGDFNIDGYTDLVIGVPYEDLGVVDAGAIQILYGSSHGLQTGGSQFLTQDDIGEFAEEGDWFGFSLATGDLNGDGYDDLAVGAPGEDFVSGVRFLSDAGLVHIIYGSAGGLNTATRTTLTQADAGEIPEAGDRFGYTLATGHFNTDIRADLVIGVPFEDLGPATNAGAVSVVYFASDATFVAQFLSQDTPGIADRAEQGDYFGLSLAAGDFNGDGADELAVGVPYEDYKGFDSAGIVHVIAGTFVGLWPSTSQLWSQDSYGIRNRTAASDRFGATLAAADFNGDGRDDLAVGAPGEGATAGAPNSGGVNVIYGSINGLTSALNQYWSAGLDTAFGSSLAADDFNGDGRTDLAIGAPNSDIRNLGIDFPQAGAIHAMYSNEFGLSSSGTQIWTQYSLGADVGENDRFGLVLAAGPSRRRTGP